MKTVISAAGAILQQYWHFQCWMVLHRLLSVVMLLSRDYGRFCWQKCLQQSLLTPASKPCACHSRDLLLLSNACDLTRSVLTTCLTFVWQRGQAGAVWRLPELTGPRSSQFRSPLPCSPRTIESSSLLLWRKLQSGISCRSNSAASGLASRRGMPGLGIACRARGRAQCSPHSLMCP